MSHTAPELLLYGHIGKPNDVYGFGILLYELYTGSRAFFDVPRAVLPHQARTAYVDTECTVSRSNRHGPHGRAWLHY